MCIWQLEGQVNRLVATLASAYLSTTDTNKISSWVEIKDKNDKRG